MDKRYYYRILGLREGASPADIKAAYAKQTRRLKQPDYADDPEYAARKMDQVRHAYSVLTGGAAPATREQKEARFEKWKDALDGGEDTIADAKRAFEKHVRGCGPLTELKTGLAGLKGSIEGALESGDEWSSGRNSSRSSRGSRMRTAAGGKKRTYYSPEEAERAAASDRSKKLVKVIISVFVFFSIFSSLITACGAMIVNLADDIVSEMEYAQPEYSATMEADPDYYAMAGLRVEEILKAASEGGFDYYGNLDLSVQEEFLDAVEWDVSDESYGEIWGIMTDAAYYLGLYSNSDAVWYITGDEEYYWAADDRAIADVLFSIMYPPTFEEVAGGVNLYTGEVILNYDGYLRFLCDVAQFQTEDVAGPAPEYY